MARSVDLGLLRPVSHDSWFVRRAMSTRVDASPRMSGASDLPHQSQKTCDISTFAPLYCAQFMFLRKSDPSSICLPPRCIQRTIRSLRWTTIAHAAPVLRRQRGGVARAALQRPNSTALAGTPGSALHAHCKELHFDLYMSCRLAPFARAS